MDEQIIITSGIGEPPKLMARPRCLRTRRFVVRAPDLKTVIVDAALAGEIARAEAEDLISFYGLRHE